MPDFAALFHDISIYIIPVILAVTLHEAAHAYAANWLGDDTAYRLGRTSLNPLVHIDPFGTVLMPLGMFLLSGGNFFFGYAKPVPVQTSRLRNPAADMPIVALAGPMANAVMALLWAVFGVLVAVFQAPEQAMFAKIAYAGVLTNLLMFAFNLLPILPLDGGRILMGLLPASLARHFEPLERYGMFIILFLVFSGNLIGAYWIGPITSAGFHMLGSLSLALKTLLGAA